IEKLSVSSVCASRVLRYLRSSAERSLFIGGPRWTNPDDQHRTALHCAAATGELGCCEFLIQNGADVLSLDERQCSPLDMACLGNQVTGSPMRYR
ncbi:unnamed protein product, partial [Ectocarpus sp. 6 AP-2014]